jgi:hypothetical protein
METLQQYRVEHLVEMGKRLSRDYEAADEESWKSLQSFLESVKSDVTALLREILSLRGIRFDEMEILDRYATELPETCLLISEIGELVRTHKEELRTLPAGSGTAREVILATQMLLQGATNRKLSRLMIDLDERLRDLEAFVPFWLEEIGRRRALLLRSLEDSENDAQIPAEGSETELRTE